MMNLNKFTLKSQEALESAANSAQEHNHPQVEPEHLLLALIEQKEGLVRNILAKMEAHPDKIEFRIREVLDAMPKVSGQAQTYFSEALSRVLNDAQKEAGRMKDEYVTVEHLLLAIATEKSSRAAEILGAFEGHQTPHLSGNAGTPRKTNRHRSGSRIEIPVARTVHPAI